MAGFVRIRQVESRPNLSFCRTGQTLVRPPRPHTTTVRHNPPYTEALTSKVNVKRKGAKTMKMSKILKNISN